MNTNQSLQALLDSPFLTISKSNELHVLAIQFVALGSLAYGLQKFLGRSNHTTKLNEPPRVPYLIPWYGHTFSLMYDAEAFLEKAAAKYGDMFTIYVMGGTYTVTTNAEVFRSKGEVLDFGEGIEDRVPTTRVLEISYGHKYRAATSVKNYEGKLVTQIIRANFKAHMIAPFSSRIMEAVETGFKKEIGENVKEIQDIEEVIQRVVSRINCLCMGGEEVGRNEELIVAMASITPRLVSAALVCNILPEWLGNIIVKKWFSLEPELDLMMSLLKPVVAERIRKNKELGDEWVSPHDYLQMAIDLKDLDHALTLETVPMSFRTAVFASVHTTSLFSSFGLHEFASRPEVQSRLREEIEAALEASEDKVLTPELVNSLPLMDSFFREVLRVNTDHISFNHLSLDQYTFSNGYQIPKGRQVAIMSQRIHFDSLLQKNDNPREFNAFQWAGRKKSHNPANDFIIFGLGPHACPGRFFAVQEIKYIFAKLLLDYNIRTKSGKRVPNRELLGMVVLPPHEALIFEPRV